MIKINLLGDALAQAGGKKGGGDAQQPVQVYVEGEGAGRASFPIAGLIIVLLALAGAGTYVFMLFSEVKGLNEKNAALEAEAKTYEKYIQLEATFRQRKQALAKKEEVIGTLKRQQALTVHFLEELANSLPEDVVFAKISQKGMNFTIEGEGRSFEAINAFYNNLQTRNRWFKNINYPGAQLNSQRSYSFKISFDLQNAV
jgi:Tfp pilus assembly protein PilN